MEILKTRKTKLFAVEGNRNRNDEKMFCVEFFSIHFNENPRATAAVLILTNYVRMLQSRCRLWAGCESQKRKRVISVLMDF